MPDWTAMFHPQLEVSEVILRASIMYMFLFLAMRFLLKRQGGTLNHADLLVVVALVDGSQPAFTGDAKSITESVIFVMTIIFWSYLLNWLSFRLPWLAFLTAAPPMVLIEDGRVNRANMRKALMTKEELMQQLREEGIDDVDKVHRALLEGNGEISVVTKEDA